MLRWSNEFQLTFYIIIMAFRNINIYFYTLSSFETITSKLLVEPKARVDAF